MSVGLRATSTTVLLIDGLKPLSYGELNVNYEESAMPVRIFLPAFGVFLILASASAKAVTLPNGTCSAGNARVSVSGGKIRSYSWKGKGYAVKRRSASSYKVGPAGEMYVRSPSKTGFRATFRLNGRNMGMNFRCK